MTNRKKDRLKIAGIALLAVLSGLIAYPHALFFAPKAEEFFGKAKLNLGLDLQGGVHLEYEAETGSLKGDQVKEAVEAAQAVIERRVNAFGVSEPLVQLAQSGGTYRIIAELPGVKDVEDAKKQIKEAPFLEFKEEDNDNPAIKEMMASLNAQSSKKAQETLEKALKGENFEELAKAESQDPGSKDKGGDLDFFKKGTMVAPFDEAVFSDEAKVGQVFPRLVESDFGWHIIKKEEERGDGDAKEIRARHILFRKYSETSFGQQYKETGLSGKNLKSARVDFGGQQGGLGEPQVVINFDDEGTKLFADITKRNLQKSLAIYIDGEMVTAPTVQAEITNGEAVITGSYTIKEANALKKRLDEGSLPVPLKLVSQQSIEASLGQAELQKSVKAGFGGFAIVSVFMILYYRFLGVVASFSLIIYSAMLLSLFKLSSLGGWPWPITLTLSGIAGFVLSIGMAVDANVLIFERIKEESRRGKSLRNALREGFLRAWPSIRDGNVSTILTAVILIWFGTGFVKGFAIILTLGVTLSMFTAVVIVRSFLMAMPLGFLERHSWLLFRSGKPDPDKKDEEHH